MSYRPRDPQPLDRTGEVALLALAGVLAVLLLAAMLGVGIASAIWGGGWVWPPDLTQAITVAGGLLSGDPGASWSDPERLPGPYAVYGTVAAVEITTVSVGAYVALLVVRLLGPSTFHRGMASRREAASVLGVANLRRASAIIRPDLFEARSRRRR